MKIAYVLNTYPSPSHSFIRREIVALEKHMDVARIAMRRPGGTDPDPQNRTEADKTTFVLERGKAKLMATALGQALRRPVAMAKAVRLALSCGLTAGEKLRHLLYLAEACTVVRLCEVADADHIHAHFGTNASAIAMLASALSDLPYSFTVHGPEEFDRQESLSLGVKTSRAAFAATVSSYGRSQLMRWTDRHDWPRIKVVHCGIVPAKHADSTPVPRVENGALRLLCIGRFVEQKGHGILVEALARCVADQPGVSVTFLGDGPMRGDLEAAVAEAGLQDNVRFAGWVNQDTVRRMLDDSHGLVLPSFAEGLPMVVMEAMASARPVIATRIAGIPELVKDGESGLLVPAGDAAALADAMLALSRLPDGELRRMGAAARARVIARHDIDAIVRDLAGHFMQAALQRPRRKAKSTAAPLLGAAPAFRLALSASLGTKR